MRYNLRNREFQALANKHGDLPSIDDMQADLGLVRAFCEAITNNIEDASREDLIEAFRLVGPALLQINKAQETVLKVGVATDQLVTKDTLYQLGEVWVQIFMEVLRKHLTERQVEVVVDELAPRMQEAVANARNSLPLQKPKLIEHQGE